MCIDIKKKEKKKGFSGQRRKNFVRQGCLLVLTTVVEVVVEVDVVEVDVVVEVEVVV